MIPLCPPMYMLVHLSIRQPCNCFHSVSSLMFVQCTFSVPLGSRHQLTRMILYIIHTKQQNVYNIHNTQYTCNTLVIFSSVLTCEIIWFYCLLLLIIQLVIKYRDGFENCTLYIVHCIGEESES